MLVSWVRKLVNVSPFRWLTSSNFAGGDVAEDNQGSVTVAIPINDVTVKEEELGPPPLL